ncbi:MAG: hypothetical protein IMZ75_04710, partial [Actinobacteria bacterium]|nr:hypothetical protein [Actinomycetota bacterium]
MADIAKRIIVPVLLTLLLYLGFFATPALAGTGEISFVETNVDLAADGTAVVAYTVRWKVLSGEFHGFYFEGNDRLLITTFSSDSWAESASGGRYGLDITPVKAGKYDIVLAGGKGVTSGDLTYTFWFPTDFAQAGYVAPTTAAGGRELTVFNWSPVQWDEASHQDHYTLKILTPYVLPAGVDPRAHVQENGLMLTEKWVNEQYRIDYQRGSGDRLELVFHKDRPGNLYHMLVQIYLPAQWFALPDTAGATAAPGDLRTEESWQDQFQTDRFKYAGLFLSGGLALLGSFFTLIRSKQHSMVTAHQGLDELRCDNLDWTPPTLELSTFRVPGKVCQDLTPLEAAFYLEVPFKDILSAMIRSLENEGFLVIMTRSPFKAKVRPVDRGSLSEYEVFLLDAFSDDGELSQLEL